MAGNPFFQNLDPNPVPDPVTPHGDPSNPEGYAKVTPTGIGPAPYNIAAPQDIAGITAALNGATALTGGHEGATTGAGMPWRDSPRQQQAAAILDSPQGASSTNVFAGFPDYENSDVRPQSDGPLGPIQGHTSDYQGTMQDGLEKYGGPARGLEGVPPEGGNMGPGIGCPGTVQDGITTYGI